MKKNYYIKTLVFSIIFFILACVVFYFLYQKIDSNNKASEKTLTEWQTENSRREGIKTLNKSIKIIEEEKALLETHFAKSSDVVPFLNTIEKLGSDVGARAQVSLVDIAKDNTGLLVEMKASGTFSSVFKFLTLLENSPYELEFISTDLKNADVQDEKGQKLKGKEWQVILKIKLLSFIS